MPMPISLFPYSIPKLSVRSTLSSWISWSPPSTASLPSPSPSAPPSNPPSSSSHPPPPVPSLLPSPATTTTATSIQTPEMIRVCSGVKSPSSSSSQNMKEPSYEEKKSDTKEPVKIETETESKSKTKSKPAVASSSSVVSMPMEQPRKIIQPKPPKQTDVVWLFDLKSARDGVPWHPNTWKVRLALNYKQIPYTTIWLTYPSMEPVLKQMCVPPMQQDKYGRAHYSVPVIVDHRRTRGGKGENEDVWAVVGSSRILDYLDGVFPVTHGSSATSATPTPTSRSRKSKSQSPAPSSDSHSHSHLHLHSRSQSHSPPPLSSSSSRHRSGDSSPSSSSTRRPTLLQSMFDSMVERVLDPPFWKMILPLAWTSGVLDEESKEYFLEVRGYGGIGSNEIGAGAGREEGSKARRWNPERYVTDREWIALREGFETIAAFCEMYGIGSDTWAKRSRPQEQRQDQEQGQSPDPGLMVITRMEIVLIAYLAALHECAPLEKWTEIRDVWCFGMWGALWDCSIGVREGRDVATSR